MCAKYAETGQDSARYEHDARGYSGCRSTAARIVVKKRCHDDGF